MKKCLSNQSELSYGQILRTVGDYAEANGLSDIRLIEADDGLVLQGTVTYGERAGQRETYQLNTEDIENLYYDAIARRNLKLK